MNSFTSTILPTIQLSTVETNRLEQLLQKVFMQLVVEGIPKNKLPEFEKLLATGDEPAILEFINEHAPDLLDNIAVEIAELRSFYSSLFE